MKENFGTCITGNRVVLVPYKKKFVANYHVWMKDPYLQEMTASEPLSEEEEYEMQESWRDDPTKCTFIVLDRETTLSAGTNNESDVELTAMAGDVNMFFNDRDFSSVAELEIMIAEEKFRKTGLGREAVYLMMHYGVTVLGITKFFVKINETNLTSLNMFKRLVLV
jgi:RimJ/RimL family protein N-acetyltransferase